MNLFLLQRETFLMMGRAANGFRAITSSQLSDSLGLLERVILS